MQTYRGAPNRNKMKRSRQKKATPTRRYAFARAKTDVTNSGWQSRSAKEESGYISYYNAWRGETNSHELDVLKMSDS